MKRISLFIVAMLLIPVLCLAEPLNPSTKTEGTTSWTLIWDDDTVSTQDITPVTDTGMNVYRADKITIQCSTLTADDTGGTSNLSTSVDVDVLASNNCSAYDTTGYYYVENAIELNADNVAKTIGLTPGMQCIKLRADNDDAVAGHTLDMTCRITATWD